MVYTGNRMQLQIVPSMILEGKSTAYLRGADEMVKSMSVGGSVAVSLDNLKDWEG
jgi:hypothetical protein